MKASNDSANLAAVKEVLGEIRRPTPRSGCIAICWGVIFLIGFLLTHFMPYLVPTGPLQYIIPLSWIVWVVLGIVATTILSRKRLYESSETVLWFAEQVLKQMTITWLSLITLGLILSVLSVTLNLLDPKYISPIWMLIVAVGSIIMGEFIGWEFYLVGIVLMVGGVVTAVSFPQHAFGIFGVLFGGGFIISGAYMILAYHLKQKSAT